jgi:hypothetical protein
MLEPTKGIDWDMEELGSDDESLASYGGARTTVVQRLKRVAALENPAPAVDKMCRSYEIVEIEGSDPESFQEGVAVLAAGLLHTAQTIRTAFGRALRLVCAAIRCNAAALLTVLHALHSINALESKDGAGVLVGRPLQCALTRQT